MFDNAQEKEQDHFDPNDLENEVNNLQNTTTNQTIDESLASAINVLTEEDRKRLLSQLEPREVFQLTILYSQAKEFNDDLLFTICDNILVFRASLNRQARKEIVEIAKANIVKANARGLLRKLFNRGGGVI